MEGWRWYRPIISLTYWSVRSVSYLNKTSTVQHWTLIVHRYEFYIRSCMKHEDIAGKTDSYINGKPCGRLAIDWKLARLSPQTELTSWNITVGNPNFDFHINFTFDSFHLAESLRHCSTEGVLIRTTNLTIRHCGERTIEPMFINSYRFSLEYYANRNLVKRILQKRVSHDSHGYFYAHYQVADFDESHNLDAAGTGRIIHLNLTQYYVLLRYMYADERLARIPFTNPESGLIVIVGELGFRLFSQLRTVDRNGSVDTSCVTVTGYDGPSPLSRVLRSSDSPPSLFHHYFIPTVQQTHITRFYDTGSTCFDMSSVHILSYVVQVNLTNGKCLRHRDKLELAFLSSDSFPIQKAVRVADDGEHTVRLSRDGQGLCDRPCKLQLTTDPGWYLDIAITNYELEQPQSRGCLHHALALYEHRHHGVEDISKPMALICHPVLVDRGGFVTKAVMPQRFTSSQWTVFVTWYSFPPSHVSVDLVIRRTPCRGTFVHCGRFRHTGLVLRMVQDEQLVKLSGWSTLPNIQRYLFSFYAMKGKMSCKQFRNYPGMPQQFLITRHHGSQCLEETADLRTLNNTFALNLNSDCFVLQYIAANTVNSAYDNCIAGVSPWESHTEELELSIHSIAEVSDDRMSDITANQTESVSQYISMEFKPHKVALTITGTRKSIGTPLLKTANLRNIVHLYTTHKQRPHRLFEDYATMYYYTDRVRFTSKPDSSSAIYKVQHRQISRTYQNYDDRISTHTGPTTSLRHPFKRRSHWNPFIRALNDVAKVTFRMVASGRGCSKLSVYIGMIHVDPFEVDYTAFPRFNFLWHQLTFATVEESVTLYHIQLYRQRMILIQLTNIHYEEREHCPLNMEIEPQISINSLLRRHHNIVESPCCTSPLDSIYYVLWPRSGGQIIHMSWVDASQLCKDSDGHLPVVSSVKDMNLLENLMLGSRFGSDRRAFYNPSRRHVRMHVYLGMNISKVNISY